MLLTPLLRHQRIALNWMCKREAGQTPRGGILADDQVGGGASCLDMCLAVWKACL
jgi:hypothetical protein